MELGVKGKFLKLLYICIALIDAGSPLKEFIAEAQKQITDGMQDSFVISGEIKLELTTIVKEGAKGKADIIVLKGDAEVENKFVQKRT